MRARALACVCARAHRHKWGERLRHGERENPQADSPLRVEPNAGINARTLRSRPDLIPAVSHLPDRATQVPLLFPLYCFLGQMESFLTSALHSILSMLIKMCQKQHTVIKYALHISHVPN